MNGQSVKDCILGEINCTNESGSWVVIDYSQKSNVAYMAVKRVTPKEEYVFACVAKFSVSNGQESAKLKIITTKIMDETEMPYYFDCPKRILNKLTEPKNEYSKKWRSLCVPKKTIKFNESFVLKNPLNFTDGVTRKKFKKVKFNGKTRYECLDTGALVCISRLNKREFFMV